MTDLSNLLFVELQEQNADKVLVSLKKLCELTTNCDDDGASDETRRNRDDANNMGAVAIVVSILNKWPDHEDIQRRAMNYLDDLFSGNEAAAHIFIKAKGVETVIKAATRFPFNGNIQYHFVSAIAWALFRTKDEKDSIRMETTQYFVGAYGGIWLVAAAMNQFPTGWENLQEWSCRLLLELMKEKKYRETMMKQGAVAAVGNTLKNYYEVPQVRSWAIKFMKAAFNDDA